ncbi:hypothetical protein ACFTY8_43770 [Streptomyces mirabilis]|uniref:hypothetical protein n=1 Tax=Streptomyces mirabilis TaxID=68239 RepID=UPI0036284E8F
MEQERELLVAYGQWRKNDSVSAEDQLEQLVDIVAALLSLSVPADSMHLYELGDTGALAMECEFDGRDFLLVLAGRQEPAWGSVLVHAVGAARGASWAVLHWPEEQPDEELVHKISDGVTVLDRTHLEAAVAGLSPLADLVRAALRRRQPHVPLAELLGVGASAPQQPDLTPLARRMSPLPVETKLWAGASAEVLLVGRAQPERPTGLACLPDEHVLITCPDGLLEVDAGSGQARWRLLLPGCHGDALVRVDGAMLVMCGSALVRWHEGRLRAVAGAFEEGAVLLPGPDGEPWVLSGFGATLGAGEGTLALTRAGETVGDQLRYPITFNAAVRSALWLDGRRFFLAAQGSSAVVDLEGNDRTRGFVGGGEDLPLAARRGQGARFQTVVVAFTTGRPAHRVVAAGRRRRCGLGRGGGILGAVAADPYQDRGGVLDVVRGQRGKQVGGPAARGLGEAEDFCQPHMYQALARAA